MEFFLKAKTVRLLSKHDKYLLADDDEETVCQDRNGFVKQARWTVEFVQGGAEVIRLKSCYGKYLTASNLPFMMGMTGMKVLQTMPHRLDSSVQWEPMRDGSHVRLRTRYGHYLRANGGVPPWRNSITHDIPRRSSSREWILWAIDICDFQYAVDPNVSEQALPPRQLIVKGPPVIAPPSVPGPVLPAPEPDSPTSDVSPDSPGTPKLESDSFCSPPVKLEGRTIYYKVADEDGHFNESEEGMSFLFKGSQLEELVERLEDETGLEDLVVCSHWKGKLYPLRLQLPPNNAAMHIIVLPSSSEAVKDLEVPLSPSRS
ncbi:hypothetical protein MLD38_000177 [Melastoma candidum]|uniref:Uncharacterized protein n=1 Tax=Melastoma candidum TaxID=119954 RepID=A0ACB9S9P2_9MYRT|nr:hypothetical protein MLD38_000177 [Melastoma candidum]